MHKTSAEKLRQFEDLAIRTVQAVECPAHSSQLNSVEFAGNDISHPLDIEVHVFLNEQLKETGLPVLSEESRKNTHTGGRPEGLYWLIDPIDGTYNLWRGLDFAGTSVALMRGPNPVFGVVKNLGTGDLYHGGTERPPSKNDQIISISTTSTLSRAVLATGLPVHTQKEEFAKVLMAEQLETIGKVRMFGSAALSLCLLAEGKVDIYWERGIFLWDVAAGLAIAKAAGANISFVARQGSGYRSNVIAANQKLLLDIVP